MEDIVKEIEKVTTNLESFKKTFGEKADKSQFEQVLKQLEDLKANSADKSKLEEVNKSLADINTLMKEMSDDIAKAKDNVSKTYAHKSFGSLVIDAIKEQGIKADTLKKNEHRTIEVKYNILNSVNKVAGTMGTGNVDAVGTNSIPYELAQFEPGLTRIVRRRPWLMNIANVSPTNKMYVQWAEQENADGSAGPTAEGSAKFQIDFDWVEKSKKVEKITAYIKVSKESLDDLDGLRSEIDTELNETIMLKADAMLLSGTGTTPEIAGLLTMDTAFDAGSFAGTIPSANKLDVLRVAIAQVVSNEFMPNYILLHPNDVAALDLEKAPDGHYVVPPFKSANGMVISGVQILENTGQTEDKFTVGDFTKFNVRLREGITIDVGLDGNDFTNNLVTILGEIRLASYVKANHAGAFVSGDFSEAITALDSGS